MRKVLPFLFIVMMLSGCSSITLLDSWKSKDFKNLNKKKILVAAKSPDLEIRKSYEKAIVNNLRKLGVNAVELHVKFPNFSNKENRTEEENSQIVKQFRNEGINVVIVTSLKNKIETRNSRMPQSVEIPLEYKNKYIFESNNQLLKVSSKSLNRDLEDTFSGTTEMTYVLESITYDLSLEQKKRLVNVCLVDVTNPKSGEAVLDKFSKIISRQFKN